MDPHSRAAKKNTSHGNEILSQDTTHLIQKTCYRRGSPWKDPAGNRTTRRPPDHLKEAQTAVIRSCLLFIRSGQNHLARYSIRGKMTRQTEEEVGRQHQGMDRPEVRQVPEGSGGQGKMEKTGCEIICGAPTTLAVKGQIMMMMMMRDSTCTAGNSLHFLAAAKCGSRGRRFCSERLAENSVSSVHESSLGKCNNLRRIFPVQSLRRVTSSHSHKRRPTVMYEDLLDYILKMYL